MGVLIVGVLTQGYFAPSVPGGKPFMFSTTDRARTAVAAVNFRTAQTQFFSRTEGRRLEIGRLRQELDGLANMGAGGRFFVDQRQELRVTTNIETRKFSEAFTLPRVR